MFDSLIESKKKIERIGNLFVKKPYIFFTLHRDSNSNYKTISFLFKQMKLFKLNFFWPLHPKIYKIIKGNKKMFSFNSGFLTKIRNTFWTRVEHKNFTRNAGAFTCFNCAFRKC